MPRPQTEQPGESLRLGVGRTTHPVFRTGEKTDFERMLDDILDRAKAAALSAVAQVEAESAARGTLQSSGTPIMMEQRITPIHDTATADAMRLIVQFAERTGIAIPELCTVAKSKLQSFTSEITKRIATAANRMGLTQLANESRERFDRHVEHSLRDVEIGFIEGKSAIVTENSTNQAKALRLLKALYDATRGQSDPVFVEELNTGLPEGDAKAAWRYLRDRRLIKTFNIDYTARINAAGINAIEDAQRRPDMPSSGFPSVSYNIVYNTMNVTTMSNSAVQQGGVHSNQNQTVTYSTQDIGDLKDFVAKLTEHIDELRLDARQKQRLEAQIATLQTELADEPDPAVVKQAGRTVRAITEGAIGSLLAAAVQPTVWTWVHQIMQKFFG